MTRIGLALGSLALLGIGAFAACDDDPISATPTTSASDASTSDSGDSAVGDAGTDGDSGRSNTDGGTSTFPTPPSVQFIGRFDDTDAVGSRAAWPGGRVAARFDGTGVSAKLSHFAGSRGGPTYANVIVDGSFSKVISVGGIGETVALASGLSPGPHSIEVEKRTDATLGTLRFEGFTFSGGSGLISPTPRLNRRVEILGDAFVSGAGVDGDKNDSSKCPSNTAPPQFDDVRKGVGGRLAALLSADVNVTAIQGKGLARNDDGSTTDTFPIVFRRSLPEAVGPWVFGSFVPDVVVIVLGAGDYDGTALAAQTQTTYNQLLTDLHAFYGTTTKIVLAVWSQHHAGLRQPLTDVVNGVVAGRPNADKPYNSAFVFPEAAAADETGCQGHATAAHHSAMAALLAAEIKAKTGWK